MLAAVRALGLPARYIAGYREDRSTCAPEERTTDGHEHGWISVMAPDGLWIDVDPATATTEPTNLITVAWGRDRSDVVPLRGVVAGPGEEVELSMSLSITRSEQRTPPRRQRSVR